MANEALEVRVDSVFEVSQSGMERGFQEKEQQPPDLKIIRVGFFKVKDAWK